MDLNLKAEEPTVIMLAGLPGSGKSTFRESLLKLFPHFKVLSTDDHIEAFAQENGKTYSNVFSSVIDLATKKMNQEKLEIIAKQESVIIDQTNLSHASRAIKLSSFAGYRKILVCFDINPSLCWSRVQSRTDKEITETVFNLMKNNLNFYQPVPIFDNIITIS